jgi:hypothetical protein
LTVWTSRPNARLKRPGSGDSSVFIAQTVSGLSTGFNEHDLKALSEALKAERSRSS